jgi:hypothetical protein
MRDLQEESEVISGNQHYYIYNDIKLFNCLIFAWNLVKLIHFNKHAI